MAFDNTRFLQARASHQATVQVYRPTLSLDGAWSFQYEDEAPTILTVPQPWEAARPDLVDKGGTAVYERPFRITQEMVGKRVWLRCGAADFYAEVWINDHYVGSHEGGYTPFAFDITDALRPHYTEQKIRVRVTDAGKQQDATLPNGTPLPFAEIPHGKQSWYSSVSGLWQSVTLEATQPERILRAHFHPDIEAGTVRLSLLVDGLSPWNGANVRVRLAGPTPVEIVTLSLQTAVPDASGHLHFSAKITLPQAELWTPDTPHLYAALVTIEQAGETLDAYSTQFGMRQFEAREGKLWLNNQPIFLAGALDQAFYPKTLYTPPSDAFLRDQFLKAKEMGLNLLRCHIKVPTESYLQLCDEIGLLVWYEIPNGARLTPAFRERARRMFEEMWERDANHPSLVIASLINESWGIDLNDPEQRQWLKETYYWAKSVAPSWLIVDNSPCRSNYHVVSDLDDYHTYYSIPDHADEYAAWVAQFAQRQAGTYSPHGDAQLRGDEPILLSEFGNWGLPDFAPVLQAEGGEPYWWDTGDIPVRPRGVQERFREQGLDRVYGDYATLAAASQEQQYLSLKYEIEEMRRHDPIVGYVITEFTDLNWECNGLLDMARNPKAFHNRIQDVQAQDILIPRLAPRTALWENETATIQIELSTFSGLRGGAGELVWEMVPPPGVIAPPVQSAAVTLPSTVGTVPLGSIGFQVGGVPAPGKWTIRIVLRDSDDRLVARTTQNVVFVPARLRKVGAGRSLWLHDPAQTVPDLAAHLSALGFTLAPEPNPATLTLATRWDAEVEGVVQQGGKALLVCTEVESLPVENALGAALHDRTEKGWWGDWASSKIWLDPTRFPSLPDTRRFDFEYQAVTPKRVLTGLSAAQITSGLFLGWLHHPAALVATVPHGSGQVLLTTYNLLTALPDDPMACLLLHDLLGEI